MRHVGYVGYMSGMKYYPGMWGLFHKRIPIKQPVESHKVFCVRGSCDIPPTQDATVTTRMTLHIFSFGNPELNLHF